MISKTTLRRLELLSARELLKARQVLQIIVASVGQPDETIEVVLDKPNRYRRGSWSSDGEGDR